MPRPVQSMTQLVSRWRREASDLRMGVSQPHLLSVEAKMLAVRLEECADQLEREVLKMQPQRGRG